MIKFVYIDKEYHPLSDETEEKDMFLNINDIHTFSFDKDEEGKEQVFVVTVFEKEPAVYISHDVDVFRKLA